MTVANARPGRSGEALDEQHAVLAGTVVVARHTLDLEAERLVEGDRGLVRRRRDAAHARPPLSAGVLEEALVQAPPESLAPVLGRDADEVDVASSGSVWERNPIRNAASCPSSSSTT